MCSSGGLAHHLSRSEPLRFSSFTHSTRPDNPPHSVSFRARPCPLPLRSALNDTVSEAAAAVSFYELLGIPATGSLLEIKQAYKQLARKYHPDVSPPGRVEEYTQRFIRVQEAYETLSDPSLRELYDHHMATGLHLAFTARRRSRFDEEMEDRNEWKNRWQSQLSELKRRSTQKETVDTMSWGARMRRERNEMS
ncbi:DNAJ-like 20 [Perilla frutescens var. hirtella]|uniref:DNAJ-like 20 n=1 Tax=Perilla frutescens var. hirtella TaxID=608512 RepID=A0AAD4JF27_PERFH|nr:DNAJ-like 20 [Perilla frutescens var. hirtella]